MFSLLLFSLLQAKHLVALSEWIVCLEDVILDDSKVIRRTFRDVFDEVERVSSDTSTLNTLLLHEEGLKVFFAWLQGQPVEKDEHNAANQLNFYHKVDLFSEIPTKHQAGLINEYFIQDGCKFPVADIDEEMKKQVLIDLLPDELNPKMFNEIRSLCLPNIHSQYLRFCNTSEYADFQKKNEAQQMALANTREVEEWDKDMVQFFLLTVKNQTKTIDVKLPRRKNALTIGRDRTNNLVVRGDTRISRSHARVEYGPTWCEFIDLGSGSGSLLNGKKVLRQRLQPGDVVEMGKSTMIFQIKKKRRFSFNS